MNGIIVVFLLLFGAWFGHRTWRESAAASAARVSLLSDAREVLQDVHETRLPSGYMKVTGTYLGSAAVLEPVVDTLNVRKLPVLWLLVTLPGEVATRATFDMMMRASGLEVFSKYHQLEHTIDRPDGYPEWCGIRTDDPNGGLPIDIVRGYLQRFHDGHGKELLITPRGVRMVVMLDQGSRAGYLAFRDAQFSQAVLTADAVVGILDDLLAIKSDLRARADARITA